MLGETRSPRYRDRCGDVSILVLLDRARGEKELVLPRLRRCSFNPCSVGSCSGRRPARPTATQPTSFNPCSVGSCSGRPERQLGGSGKGVSILVLLDRARGAHRHHSGIYRLLVSILVLLDRARGAHLYLQLMWSTSRFNPCSVGSCSGSRPRGLPDRPDRQFQSLFCWIVLGEADTGDFSLAYIGFNPCSVGSCSGSMAPSPESARPKVSILVLLDRARGVRRLKSLLRFSVVSILVLLDRARGVE